MPSSLKSHYASSTDSTDTVSVDAIPGAGSHEPTTAPFPKKMRSSVRGAQTSASRFRLSRTVTATVLLLVIVVAMATVFVPQMWRETALREAYLPQLEEMARRDPADERVLALLGVRLAQAKEFPEAAVNLQRAAAAGADDPSVWLTLAGCYAAMGDVNKAMAALRLNARQKSSAPQMEAALKRCAALKEASAAEIANAICPDGFEPVVEIYGAGSILNPLAEWQGRRDPEHSGFATRQKWVREQPKDVPVLVLWSRALMRNRRFDKAETNIDKALKLKPKSLEANLVLADLRFEAGLFGTALVQYKKCLDIEPNFVPALIRGGECAVQQKLRLLPVQWLEKAVKLSPDSADAWVGMGRAYFNQGQRYDKALQAYQTAERLAPERTDYFHRYAEMLRINYRYDDAIALLRRRLAADPADASAQYLLATHLLDNKQSPATVSEAEQLLRKSTTAAPDVAAPQVRLGQLLLEQDRPQDALEFLQNALTLDPHNFNAATALARAYRRVGNMTEFRLATKNAEGLGEYLKARESLEDKERQQPENMEVHQQLAELYTTGKETEKAQRQLDMLYMLKNHPEEARKGIKALHNATTLGVGVDSRPATPDESTSNTSALGQTSATGR